MADDFQYKVVLDGRILDGFNPDDVKSHLGRLFKADMHRVHQILARAPITIKKNIDYAAAVKYAETLRRSGVSCEIQAMAGKGVEGPWAPEKAAYASAVQMQAAPPAHPADEPKVRPGVMWFVIAGLLCIVPSIVAGIMMGVAVFTKLSSGIELTAPGAADVTIAKPDKYILWFTTRDDRASYEEPPKDITISVTRPDSGHSLTVLPPSFESRETSSGVERQSIGEVQIEEAGLYRVAVAGDFPASTLVLRRSFFAGFVGNFLVPVFLALMGWIAGPVLAVIVAVKRSRRKARASMQGSSDRDDRQWAMFSHLGTFSAFFVPFGNIIAPLVIWQVKKNESLFVVQHSKESLNFQISLTLYSIVATFLVFVLIGLLLLPALFIFGLVAVIIAGIKANDGQAYTYPLTIRIFR
jgi:uncharacterized Tic20 family protein